MVDSKLPRLTVVTVNLNHGEFIETALRSVWNQGGVSVEHLVIDGGSTDDSHAILAAWPQVRTVLKPGVDSHGAMNHGLALARGEFIGFLNADDRYEPDSLAGAAAAFDAEPARQTVSGGVRYFRDVAKGEEEICRFDHLQGPDLMLETTFGAPAFNSWFFRTSMLRELGGLRTEWRIAADRDLLMRLLPLGRPGRLPGLVYHYRVHDRSRTLTPKKTLRSGMAREHIRLAKLHAAGAWSALPGGRRLLDEWRALEALRLLAGLGIGGTFEDIRNIATSPWMKLPAALRRRRRWLAAMS